MVAGRTPSIYRASPRGSWRPRVGARPVGKVPRLEVMHMNIGLFILRVVVGGLFFGHGAQKLFGWFEGYGLEGTGGFMESLGYKPGKRMAFLAGLSEAGGGFQLVFGLLTPVAAAAGYGAVGRARMDVPAVRG